MSLRINSEAPNFTAETTQGTDQLPQLDRRWLGDPVLAPQGLHAGLHHRARLHGRAEAASSTSATPRSSASASIRWTTTRKWAKDIEETQGHAVNYPMIGDPELKVATAYDMLPEGAGTTSEGRTAADNATVRSVFIIGPDKKIKAMLTYPMSTGRNFDEVLRLLDSCQLTAKHKVATPVNWKHGEDVIIVPAVSDEQAKAKFPNGWKTLKPYLRIVPQPK